MTDKLKTLIMMAVEREGTYDPDDALPAVEEKMNNKEFTLASTFLRWCVLHGKKFGTATFDVVFKEFKKSVA